MEVMGGINFSRGGHISFVAVMGGLNFPHEGHRIGVLEWQYTHQTTCARARSSNRAP